MEVKDKNETTTKIGINNSQFINFNSSVKSKYIRIIIFSFLNEKNKLDLIKYNLKLQKILEIDINTYKEKSQSIKIGKNDGYCRIYDLYTMALKLEGEYKNGKKNGKGKEFYKSHEFSYDEIIKSTLIFEGEYLNGKRNGKGKEYYNDGKLKFEGEYINGKISKGIIYIYDCDRLIFNGEFSNGEKNGLGKEYYNNGKIKFEGEFLNGKKWNGIIYNNYNNDFMYEIKNGNGYIKEYDEEGNLLFEGEYINGDKKGKEYMIKKYWIKELIFEGYYLNDEKWTGIIKYYKKRYRYRYDSCKCYMSHESSHDLEYETEVEIRIEEVIESNLLKFEGEYLNGERNGKGKEYDAFGKVIFEGYFLMGKKKYSYHESDYDNLTLEYEGEISEGKRHGNGKEYSLGRIIFEGEYLKGERWNGIVKEYDNNGVIIKEKYYLSGKIFEDDKYEFNENLNYKDEHNPNEKEIEKITKEFFEESDKIRFEGNYYKNEKWNGIMYNRDDNFKIEIKNGKWSLNDSNFKFKYLGRNNYIIQDKNGKTNEYHNGLLLYEGKYLNDKRNGKGIEYDKNGKILFLGEYKNGKRWNGKIKGLIEQVFFEIDFEGKYINGEGIGKGKKYFVQFSERLLEYEGEFKNYEKSGYGKEYSPYKKILIYEGEFLNDRRNGKGEEYYDGRLIFKGEYLNGKRWNGKYRSFNNLNRLEFEGELINGERKGKEYHFGILIYEGEYLNVQKNGKGREYYKNGKIKFEGEYILDIKWNGNMFDPYGNFIFKMSNGEGNGKEYDNDGYLIYDGEYLNGVKNGKGKEYLKGKIKYEGEYLNGKRNGFGKEFKFNKLIFEGEYLNGKRNGKGKEYFDLLFQ